MPSGGRAPTAEDEAPERLEPLRRRIEEAILAAPATDLRDVAAKMIVLSGEAS